MSTVLRWRLASSFHSSLAALWGVSLAFAESVAQVSAGQLQIVSMPADEPIAPPDVLSAVAAGRVEMGHTAGAFHGALDPVLALGTVAPFGLDARRHSCWLEGDGRMHGDAAWLRAGVVGIPCGNTGAQMGGWFKRPIGRPEDFRGLRIHTSGLPAMVYAELGAEPTLLPVADIAGALKDGRLDAVDGIGPYDDRVLGFHRSAAYCHYPGVLEPSAALSLIVNAAAWASLPEHLRGAIRLAAGASGAVMAARYEVLNPPAIAALLREGAILVRFPDAVLSELGAASGRVLDRLSASDFAFAAALRSYRAFAEGGRHWHMLSERSTQDVIER